MARVKENCDWCNKMDEIFVWTIPEKECLCEECFLIRLKWPRLRLPRQNSKAGHRIKWKKNKE